MRIPEKSPDIGEVVGSGPLTPSADLIRFAKEYNGKYLHWDELRYREFGDSTRFDVWRMMKIARMMSYHRTGIMDLEISYSLLDDRIQQMLHRIDSGMASGIPTSGRIDDRKRIMLSVDSMMEESIASSQLEGASTTTRLAKKLLCSGLPPKDESQRMILNNYRAMQLIKDRLTEPLNPELIKDIHRTVTEGLMDDLDASGRFREDDSIAVRDVYEDVAYHIPVGHEAIADMIDRLCEYANSETEFVHPIIKGIIIHYVLGYIHPFLDGNGRVSRSLFYWYCLKNGYPMIEYLSISKVIKNHRQDYDMAYLLSETDDNDVSYFIRYNLRMISEAMDIFDAHLEKNLRKQEDAARNMGKYGLNYRQSQILRDMMDSGEATSQYELSVKYQTTVSTIRRDLLKLVKIGMVRESGKDGHRQLYIYSPKN